MAAHSRILAWRILWTEDPGGLQSMASQRVGCNQSNLARTLFIQQIFIGRVSSILATVIFYFFRSRILYTSKEFTDERIR